MLEHLRYRFAFWRAYRGTVRELARLDRRTLADMGLESPSLDAIKARAREAACEACR